MHNWKSLAVAGFAIAACAPQAALLSQNAVIFPGRLAGSMLHQCSRKTPNADGPSWAPSVDDISALEAILPIALMAQTARGDPDWSKVTSRWRRQYVGIRVDGKRLIYGNFFPRSIDPGSWRTSPTIICDGGPEFFGVVYDVATRRIVNLAFNGVA